MNRTTQTRPGSRAEREAAYHSARRKEQASIVAGLQTILEQDEQLLGFARGRIAGGFRGKLNVGPEAFFAPFVNIGLTERRFVLQHIRPENGKPSAILPHSYPITDITSLAFSDIETFGAEPACRLTMRPNNELFCRLRLRGVLNSENAKALAEVFTSLTASRRSATTPTQRTCAHCAQILDQPYRYCPYCSAKQPEEEVKAEESEPEAEANLTVVEDNREGSMAEVEAEGESQTAETEPVEIDEEVASTDDTLHSTPEFEENNDDRDRPF